MDPSGEWAERFAGFKWTVRGFNVTMRYSFFKSRSLCLSYASDIIRLRGSSGKYAKMGRTRIAVELFAHALGWAIGYRLMTTAQTALLIKAGAKIFRSANYVEVNNNDGRAWAFYTVWYAAVATRTFK
ncbi:MAG: hypothetical protein VB139_08195 [Coriobacteriia bacterium]|nr:hypothetical protein [Coriobacteriia bacterium]